LHQCRSMMTAKGPAVWGVTVGGAFRRFDPDSYVIHQNSCNSF